jgi:hypothetical protein
MSTDIFSRSVTYGGAFSADGVVVTFAGFGAGMLTQSIEYAYQQSLNVVYELGSRNAYMVAGRAMGQAGITRIIGPTPLLTAFYTRYGNVCYAGTNSLSFSVSANCGVGGSAGATNAKPTSIGINNTVIKSIQGNIQVQDMLMHETVTMVFLSMTMQTGS